MNMEYKQTWQAPSGFKFTIENSRPWELEHLREVLLQLVKTIDNKDFLTVDKYYEISEQNQV